MIEVLVPFAVISGAGRRPALSHDAVVGQVGASGPFVALRGADRGGRRAQGAEVGR